MSLCPLWEQSTKRCPGVFRVSILSPSGGQFAAVPRALCIDAMKPRSSSPRLGLPSQLEITVSDSNVSVIDYVNTIRGNINGGNGGGSPTKKLESFYVPSDDFVSWEQ